MTRRSTRKSLFSSAMLVLLLATQPTSHAAPAASPAVNTSTRWLIETVDSTYDVGRYTSLGLQPGTNIPFVSYYDATNKNLHEAYYKPQGGNCGPSNTWQCFAEPAFSSDEGQYTSLDFQTDGRSAIVFYDVANTVNVYDGPKSPGAVYQFGSRIDSESLGTDATGLYNSLKIDSGGTAHVAYYNQSPAPGALRFATYTGGSTNSGCGSAGAWDWHCDTIESGTGVGRFPALDLNFVNRPSIAYLAFDVLKLASYSGSGGNCGPSNSWQCDVIDSVEAHDISLHVPKCLLNCSGVSTQIAYYDAVGMQLKYAKRTGTNGNCGPSYSWRCEVIESLGVDSEMGVSLGVNRADEPIIAYHTIDSQGHGILKVARYVSFGGNCGPSLGLFGHTWHCELVDDGGGTRNVGRFASLALSSAGLASIAYYDATSGDLVVAREQRQIFLPLIAQ